MMKTDKIGLYVHIPFCLKKCNYCDFCSFSDVDERERKEYISALVGEIKSYKKEPKIKLDSIFFGGGTPSLLEPVEIEKIVAQINDSFEIDYDCEFTLEANPKTLTRDKCISYKSLGVNRISIGAQSIHESELKALGRIHSFSDFLDSYRLAGEYFDNVSVDLMYGIPEQTVESFRSTLREIISLSPSHISVYGLIVEPGTPFYRMRDDLPLPSEDTECDMYSMASEMLGAVGYQHYEISNYAKPNCQCRHNLKYWHAEEYIGVGVAAASYFGKRYTNTSNLDEYLSSFGERYNRKYEEADPKSEYVMLGLRLAEGISLAEYRQRFGEELLDDAGKKIEEFIAYGYMRRDGERLSLTERGFYVSNYIISELI